ncbi:MAG: hypothetical protein ACK504_08600 [Bacteroidota bacterium]
MIRFGTYTRYNDYDFRLLNKADYYRIVCDGTICPFSNFTKYANNFFYLDVPKENITNAFSISTFGIYKGYQFDVNTMIDNSYIGIVTDNKEAFDKLNLEFRDRGVYQKEIKISELEKLWEVRSISNLDLPIPEGLKEYEEIEIPKNI